MELSEIGVINNLYCNGTDGIMGDDTPNGPQNGTLASDYAVSQTTLSRGSWAGIGIAAGLLFLGMFGTIVWLILRNRRMTQAAREVQIRDQHHDASLPEENTISEICGAEQEPWGGQRAQLEGTEIQELGGDILACPKVDDSRADEVEASGPVICVHSPVELGDSRHDLKTSRNETKN